MKFETSIPTKSSPNYFEITKSDDKGIRVTVSLDKTINSLIVESFNKGSNDLTINDFLFLLMEVKKLTDKCGVDTLIFDPINYKIDSLTTKIGAVTGKAHEQINSKSYLKYPTYSLLSKSMLEKVLHKYNVI